MNMTNESPPPPSTALATREDAELELALKREAFKNALEPQSYEAARTFAEMIAKSGMFLSRDGEPPTVGSLMLRIMTGRTLGLPASIALQHVYDVYGRTGISAALKRTLVRRHPERERFELVEYDDTHAVFIVKRRGNTEKRFPFTIEDAKRAQLLKKDSNWEKWPARMLIARASSWAADAEFEDATMGIPTVDELYDGVIDVVPDGAGGHAAAALPAKDWTKETAAVRSEIVALVEKGDTKTAREKFKAFEEGGAPPESVAEVKQAYNETLAAVKAKASTPTANKPEPSKASTPTAQQPLGGVTAPRGAYLPPEKRGDNYEGPEDPPAGGGK